MCMIKPIVFIISLAIVVHAQDDFWQRTNSPAGIVRALAVSGEDTVFTGSSLLFGNNNIALRSLDGGETWNQIMVGLLNNGLNTLLVDQDDVVWAGTVGQNVFRSDDNGETWTTTGLNDEDGLVWSLASNNNGTICAGLSGNFPGTVYCHFSDNPGWQFEDSGFSQNVHSVFALAIDPANNIYANVGNSVNTSEFDGVYRLRANGNTWENVFPSTAGQALLIHPNGDIFASASGEVFRSIDNGLTWQLFNTGLDGGVACFAVNADGDIFAARSTGVYRLKNGESIWIEFNVGLTDPAVNALALNDQGVLFAATNGGVFKSRKSTVTSVDDAALAIPAEFDLRQNYPNPFNPKTTIQYDLPNTTKVELQVYNLVGQQVRTLLNKIQSAGAKAVVWNGKDNVGREVSSGVYIYTLKVGSKKLSRKMVLLQ